MRKINSYFSDFEQTKKTNSYFADFKQIICQNLLSEKLGDLRDAMPRHWSLCFLVSPCNLQEAMPCQWSSSDLPRVLRNWESDFYSQVLFTLYSFLMFSRLCWSRQFHLKVSRASCWSSKHSPDTAICLNDSNSQ